MVNATNFTDTPSYSMGRIIDSRIERAAQTKPLELGKLSDRENTQKKLEAQASAIEHAKLLLSTGVINQDTGNRVISIGRSFKHVKSHLGEPERIAILRNIDDVVGKAVWLTGQKPHGGSKKDTERKQGVRYHNLAVPVNFEGKKSVAFLLVKKDDKGRNLYDIESLDIVRAGNSTGKTSSDKADSYAESDSVYRVIEDYLKVKSDLIDSNATFSLGRISDLGGDPNEMTAARERTPEERLLARSIMGVPLSALLCSAHTPATGASNGLCCNASPCKAYTIVQRPRKTACQQMP